MFQWIGILAALVFAVALRYEAPSEAGMRMNASPDSALSQSLRGYWKLDTGSGTSPVDSSGNGNDLSFTGSPSWTTGNIGPYALDFSGSGQYLSVTDPSSGVLDFNSTADRTITGWFNRDTFANDHTIIAKRNSQSTNTDAGYIVWIDDATDTINFTVGDGGGTASDQYTIASDTSFTEAGWHHFAAVWDESYGAFLYTDGKLEGSNTTSTSSIGSLSNSVAFAIGAESDGDNPFDGKIDDVRIYGYALSADEISKLFIEATPSEPVDTGLAGHWTFDGPDVQGTLAIDRSSFNKNGTITGTTKAIGKLGQALSFNGSSDHVITPTIPDAANFSWSFWIKSSDTTGYILSWGFYAGCRFGYTSNKVSCSVSSDSDPSISTAVNDDEWHHIVYVVSGSSQTLYTDGSVSDNTSTETPNTSTTNFNMGNDQYAGLLDSVRFYSRALSADEVAELYAVGE